MSGCCVPNCSNRSEKGFRLFRLPQNEPRRNIWIQLVAQQTCPPELKFVKFILMSSNLKTNEQIKGKYFEGMPYYHF
ncbi:hypothetical protein MTP99_006875 [Tenebrio molitor]|nr:hypothetical protein MTP99_006875 [Tenebrio molitor]